MLIKSILSQILSGLTIFWMGEHSIYQWWSWSTHGHGSPLATPAICWKRFVTHWALWRRAYLSWQVIPPFPHGPPGGPRGPTWFSGGVAATWRVNEVNIWNMSYIICQKHKISNLFKWFPQLIAIHELVQRYHIWGTPKEWVSTIYIIYIYITLKVFGSKTMFGQTFLDSKPGLSRLQSDCFPLP